MAKKRQINNVTVSRSRYAQRKNVLISIKSADTLIILGFELILDLVLHFEHKITSASY